MYICLYRFDLLVEEVQSENCPTNALLWLRNHTRGKEERIFTYEEGRQEFW